MSCHGCARNFSFMLREHGCASCGFSYCSKCLNNKICRNCLSQKSSHLIADDSVEKKLHTLENPNKSPIVVYKQSGENRLTSLKRGLSLEDQALVDRLSKLKTDVKAIKEIPSQREIEERLARLKGISPEVYKKNPLVTATSLNPNIDPVTQLLNQVAEESAIDLQSDCGDDGIQKRLNDLTLGKESAAGKELLPDDSDDEEQQVSKIVEKALAENRLGLDDEESDDCTKMDEEELPWCELCNDDAQLRCMECDGDLYCRRCWKETHREPDLKRHRIENYKPSK